MLEERNYYYDQSQGIRNIAPLRKANDAFEMIDGPELPTLFDAFWQPSELAMLFGPSGVGKSLLAVQIADALARGEHIVAEGPSPVPPQRVLYVDLVMSDLQFAARYAPYEFAPTLYRSTPRYGFDLFDWLYDVCGRDKISTIVIDDLTMVDETSDGLRERLQLMHYLRLFARSSCKSILVLADSYPFVYESGAQERALRRSQILCSVADSTFALVKPEGDAPNLRHLVQTRGRSDELVWTNANPLPCTLTTLDSGLTGFRFDPPETCDELAPKIIEVIRMHDEGKTFRTIAAHLGMSKSQAQRLYSLGHRAEDEA